MFRFVVFNIHQWETEDFRDNSKEVLEYLRKLDADFVCFNEVWGSSDSNSNLPSFSKSLNCSYYYGTTLSNFGNAILTKYKIIDSGKHGSVVNHQEIRNVVRVKVETKPKHELNIFCLHTDQMREEVRIGQMKEFYGKYISNYSNTPQLICGDFNAIRKDDYSREYFKNIQDFRSGRFWEPAYEDVTKFMLTQKYTDCWRLKNPKEIDKEVITSRKIDTRIDYIFCNDLFLKFYRIEKCYIDRTATMSDHWPIVMEFKLKENE